MTQTACHFATSDENERFVQFVNWLAARGRSEATARSYRSDWQDLAAWYRRAFGRPFTAQALDAEVVVSWREAGRARGKSPATLTRRLAFVRTYGRWLGEGSGGDPSSQDRRWGRASASNPMEQAQGLNERTESSAPSRTPRSTSCSTRSMRADVGGTRPCCTSCSTRG